MGYSHNIPLQFNANNQLTTQGFVQMDNALPTSAAYFSNLVLNWQISVDGRLTWISPVGPAPGSGGGATTPQSSNPTYVTLANPNGWNPAGGAAKPQIPVSDFYIGTENTWIGLGAIVDNSSLVSSIWTGFEGLNITSADGTALRYWASWVNTPFTTASQLLLNGNGQCTSWTSLFVDVLRAWGDADVTIQNKHAIETNPATTTGIVVPVLAEDVAPRNFNQFLVGNWRLAAAPAIPNIPAGNMDANRILGGWTNYAVVPFAVTPAGVITNNPNLIGVVNGQNSFMWPNAAAIAPEIATPAQNNTNPAPAFQNHMVVLIGGVLYDPSYGVTYAYAANNQLGGFVATLGGIMTVIPYNNNSYNFNLNGVGGNSYWVALFKPVTAAMLLFS